MSVTAIIQSYRRQENISVLINCLRNQTIKPKRIIVWNDNDGSGSMLSDLGQDVEIINTNTNYNGNYGAFVIAYMADTDYIAILDDDCPPGKKWFEFCIKNMKRKSIFAGFGVLLKDNKYTGRKVIRSKMDRKISFKIVDVVGNTYFFPKNAVLNMFSIRPQSWHNNVDIHFSFLARKYGWRLLIPNVVDMEELPILSSVKLSFKRNQKAMSKSSDHLQKRDEYVRWAIKKQIIEEMK